MISASDPTAKVWQQRIYFPSCLFKTKHTESAALTENMQSIFPLWALEIY
jgi:hypothetical protein